MSVGEELDASTRAKVEKARDEWNARAKARELAGEYWARAKGRPRSAQQVLLLELFCRALNVTPPPQSEEWVGG